MAKRGENKSIVRNLKRETKKNFARSVVPEPKRDRQRARKVLLLSLLSHAISEDGLTD